MTPLDFDDKELPAMVEGGHLNSWSSNEFVDTEVMELSEEDMNMLEDVDEELPDVTTNTGEVKILILIEM
jgi:hypothetical protein